MKKMNLGEGIWFRDAAPASEPLYVSSEGRILRFALKPGQHIAEHKVPSSPFYVVVLQGEGVFVGGDGVEQRVGPNTLLVFEPGEVHSVRADREDFVFVGFLHGVTGARADKTGGTLGREAE